MAPCKKMWRDFAPRYRLIYYTPFDGDEEGTRVPNIGTSQTSQTLIAHHRQVGGILPGPSMNVSQPHGAKR